MLPVALNTELCPATWAKSRAEIVLKVCSSLHLNAIHMTATAGHQDHCKQKIFVTSPEKGHLVSRMMNLLKSQKKTTKMLFRVPETHGHSLFQKVHVHVNKFTCRRGIIAKRTDAQDAAPGAAI